MKTAFRTWQSTADKRERNIMTIHKSKGLEFPVVFAPLLEREYAVREQTRQELWECLLERHLDGDDSYELVQGDQLVMAAGTYSHPSRRTPFDEQSPEYRENLRQAAWDRNLDTRGDR